MKLLIPSELLLNLPLNDVDLVVGTSGSRARFTRDICVSSMAQLDAMICQVAGFDLGKMLYISSGNNMFGTYSAELLIHAKAKLEGWFPAPIEGLREPT